MRSLRDGQRHSGPAPRRGSRPGGDLRRPGASRHRGAAGGLAIDLGSSGARAWVSGRGLVTGAGWDEGFGRPVRRGRIVDPDSCARLLARLVDTALGADRHRSVIALSHPVLAGTEYRGRARELLASLGVRDVVAVSSARAVAASLGAPAGGPLLVVDMGAGLTEVTLLVDGMIVDARQAESGLGDLHDPGGSGGGGYGGGHGDGRSAGRGTDQGRAGGAGPGPVPAGIAGGVLDMIMSMWRQDKHGAVRGALRRGPVLTGGGALRPDVTRRISLCLGTPARLADDPSTAVVRGAGLILDSVLGHTGRGGAAGPSGRAG
ncbi:rod shape-determining protein MreC [Streptomyces nitrosporeus]|uniref:rod shape-determining protein MreC n=1 Tax=Streptomyces nitrosporeus TaxID=28894 RepID=UPI00198584EF|nr:hypothetical protein GCM10010327_53890 [Streptomyces nitrosporeus]